MSLADAIGFFLVLLTVGVLVVFGLVEAYWRLRQRIDVLKAQTLRRRRELGLSEEPEPAK